MRSDISVPRPLVALAVCITVVVGGCQDGTNYAAIPNPTPPYSWYPFWDHPLTSIDREAQRATSAWNSRKLQVEAKANGFVTGTADLACLSKVQSLTVSLTGPIVGGLKFNQAKRMGARAQAPALNGNNTTLGGFWVPGDQVAIHHFKFQVIVTYDDLTEAFYGQMFSGPLLTAFGKRNYEFHDDSPENDWSGLNWTLGPGEKKEDFPILEVEGTTVRWIDAPEAHDGGLQNSVPGIGYAIVYAGACGIVTHQEIVEISYPAGAPPTARMLTPAQFTAAVAGWTYEP
jgi:hypothetical protein